MRVLVTTILVIIAVSPAAAQSTYVDGHTRQDGTYVPGHYRSNPDSSRTNNFSSTYNYNPYTGKQGKVDPYAPQPLPTYGNNAKRRY